MGFEPPLADPAKVPDAARFRDIAKTLDAGEATYLRRRRLLDGPDAHPLALVTDLRDRLVAQLTESDRNALIDQTTADRARCKRVTLNVVALLALQGGRWDAAQSLAREVINRDHHDLVAQRIVDAAVEQVTTPDSAADRWLASRTCHAPFREMESRTNGQVHFCCSAWQPVPIGKLDEPGPDGFWNSVRAREIRRSVRDGDFSHCSRWHCPAIAARRLPPRTEAEPAPVDLRVNRGPERVILSHDRSCNISCPSCRTDLINLPHHETEHLNEVFQTHLLSLVRQAAQIKVTGSGDPFGSRHFRHVIARLTGSGPPRRRIQLHTNGLLANERAWNDLGLWDNVSSVWVSVDATDPETYAVLRRGGDFATLIGNLRFLGVLRQRGAIDSLRLDFVVQQANYDEMGDFVDLAQRIGADGVYFLRLRNWGHFSTEAFRAMDVCSPDHPEYLALLRRLADPRLLAPQVDLGSMTALVAAARQCHPVRTI